MSDRLTAELGHLAEELARSETPAGSEELARVAEHIAKAFEVKPDEVAILALSSDGRNLKFVIPEKLQAIGVLPMTSTSALAVRTARDKRAELSNSFAGTRHATVFEGVPLGRRRGESIHKIMSAPIVTEGKTAGVVQVSRKGRTPVDAGVDFTQRDLQALVGITAALAPFLKLWQGT